MFGRAIVVLFVCNLLSATRTANLTAQEPDLAPAASKRDEQGANGGYVYDGGYYYDPYQSYYHKRECRRNADEHGTEDGECSFNYDTYDDYNNYEGEYHLNVKREQGGESEYTYDEEYKGREGGAEEGSYNIGDDYENQHEEEYSEGSNLHASHARYRRKRSPDYGYPNYNTYGGYGGYGYGGYYRKREVNDQNLYAGEDLYEGGESYGYGGFGRGYHDAYNAYYRKRAPAKRSPEQGQAGYGNVATSYYGRQPQKAHSKRAEAASYYGYGGYGYGGYGSYYKRSLSPGPWRTAR